MSARGPCNAIGIVASMTPSFFVRAPHVFLLAWALVMPPAHAADPGKTLHVTFPIAETSFDPAFASDGASDNIIANVMESMLDYDYLVRPVKLVPRTLEAMPTVEDNGKTYTGVISLVGSDGLSLKGCAFGFICEGETWRRVK